MNNIFIVGTGRCGSVTLSKFLAHNTTHTVGHESQAKLPWSKRDYGDYHIEIDNRLTWFRDIRYCETWALVRDREEVKASFMRRKGSSIIKAVRDGVYMNPKMSWEDAVDSYLDMVEQHIDILPKMSISDRGSIEQFLREYRLELPEEAWKELDIRYNKS